MLTGTPAEKRPLGKPRRRWEDNIRMDLKEIGVNMRTWVDSAQGRAYWRAPYECATEPPASVSHGVSYLQETSGRNKCNIDSKSIIRY